MKSAPAWLTPTARISIIAEANIYTVYEQPVTLKIEHYIFSIVGVPYISCVCA